MVRIAFLPFTSTTIHRTSAKQKRCAFSLIELIVTIGIISIIGVLALAAVQSARKAAADIERLNWRRQRILDEPPSRKNSFNILFIGNSHTVNGNINIPEMLVSLSRSGGRAEVRPTLIVVGGRTLREHWDDGRALELIRAPGPDWFDFVVLQGQSQEPCLLSSDYLEYNLRFASACKETKAIPIVYQLFERSNGVCPQEILTKAGATAVKQLQGDDGIGEICPVGEAWKSVRLARPDLELHQPDGNHSNETGAYLTACVFYSVVHRKSPEGLPNSVTTSAGTMLIEAELAGFLQRHAWTTAENWRKRTQPWFVSGKAGKRIKPCTSNS